ncbi:hypothetical protein ACF0H5_003937 [Mactra antiquata]
MMDYYKQYWVLLVVWLVICYTDYVSGSSTTPSTKKPKGFNLSDEDDSGFPAWLIGVIVLSSLALIILVGTIIQRLLRRRANRMEGYHIRS